MADSTPNIPQIETAQAQKEVTANENFGATTPAMIFARNALTSAGLIWGYLGGRWGGEEVDNGTLTLPDTTVSYIVADRTTGEVLLAADSPSEWADTSQYGRLYKVTAGALTVTSWEDHRAGPGGIFESGGGFVAGANIQIDDIGGHFGSPTPNLDEAIDELADRIDGAAVAIQIVCGDLVSAVGAGTNKAVFRMPHAMTLTAVRGSLATAQASGSIFTLDINASGSSILSTKITIDNTEKTSVTAATQPVLSDISLADDEEVSVDVDQVGNGTAIGPVVTLLGYRA